MKSDVKIGISAKFHNRAPVFYGESKRHIQYLETSIAKWVAKSGAVPLMIPSESADSEITKYMLDPSAYARELDALILQGGVDIHPTYYGKRADEGFGYYDKVRDRYELQLIEAFIKERKPILGICRGLQLLNVHFGGTLHADLEKSGYGKHLDTSIEEKYIHEVEILEGSILNRIYPAKASVVSLHHQGIDQLGSSLKVEAYSVPDRIVEAVSFVDDQNFILGVQWHPEFYYEGNETLLDSQKLLQMFLEVVKNRKFFGEIRIKKRRPMSFSKSSSLTLGAELELQIIEPNTYNLFPISPDILKLAEPETTKIKSEIFQSMLEIETDICADTHQIEADFAATYEILMKLVKQRGALIGSIGTHPFGLYKDRIITRNARYEKLIEQKQWIARRIAIFGYHCHVGARNSDEAIQLYRFYLSLSPLLLGLSASSPFFQSEETGLYSVRSTFFESTPAGGHPPILNNWSEFEGMMTKMLRSKSIASHKDLWWDVRPSLNYGTIELRICDSMPTLQENIALTALIHILGHAFLNFQKDMDWPKLSDWSYRENKWRALRHGLNFDFIFNDEGGSRPAKELLLTLLDELQVVTDELGYQKYVQLIREKMVHSSPTDRLMEVYKKTGSLEEVVKRYCHEFATNQIAM